ncbi:PAS domain S-box protein [Lutibacter sp.]|uniref:PAS domain S-box protein n=1 Tax=Lutibacter sp. TaxID=1925666 RepID=UPI0035682C20
MKNIIFFFLIIITNINAQEVVKVGAFNFYPGIFQDTDGKIKGFYVEALNEIAEKENKKFVYVYGSWDEGLQRIKNGEVDILTSVAFTEERSKFMDYSNTPLLTVWGEVYVIPNSEINGILDLEGKTIAIMKSDFSGAYLKQLTSKLTINCEFIETTDFEEVFNLISSKKVDAGVVNNTFGAPKFKEYKLRSSGIIFNPFDIFFTVKKDTNGELLKFLDEYFHNWKHDRNSVFNIARQKWSHGKVGSIEVFPQWLKNGIYSALLLILVLIIFIGLLRYKVRVAKVKAKESEKEYKDVVETTSDLITIVDGEGKFLFVSKASIDFFELEPKDCIGKSAFDFVNSDDREYTMNKFSEWLNSSESNFHFENKTISKKGKVLNVSWNIHIERNNNQIVKITSIARDITKLKKTEFELIKAKDQAEESEKYLDNIINNIGDPIFVKDEHSRLLIVNEAFCKIFGLSKNEIIGKTLAEDVLPEERENFLKIDRQVLKDGNENINEELLTTKGSKTITISTRKTRFIDDNGNRYLIGVIRNITKVKEKEIELIKAKEKAEESDRLKSAFLSNMSHEIRTPMNGILGFSGLLKNPNLTGDQQQKFIEIIEKSGARMLNIINDIVDISKIEAGLMEVNLIESNVNEQIEYIYTFFKPEVETKGLTLLYKNELPSKETIIKTDREKLFAILTNLVKNAIKYSIEGSIELGYHKNGSSLEFYVKDTGIGIPKDRQEAIFERFIQADISDKMAHQGAGLGLSITKAYVETLGGKIWVESQEGKGSTFYFTLPYNAEQKEKISIDNEIILNETGKYDSSEVVGLKILIVEDDETSSSLIGITVENISSEIIKVMNGLEAIEACRNNPDIDLILMDIKMPVMDGYSATQQIRQFNKDVIIIAQTAYGLAGDREKALSVGCNDYISKPIDGKLLLLLMQKYFN